MAVSFEDDPSVVAAVARDLAAIAKRDPELAESTLAASALALAAEMDSQTSATSKSMCARVLLDTMTRLFELAPDKGEVTPLDEIRARRDRKVARLPNAEGGVAAGGDRSSGRGRGAGTGPGAGDSP